MPGDQLEVVKAKYLLDADSESRQVVHVRGPPHSGDDGVVADGPEKRAGSASHANAAAQATRRAEASLSAGGARAAT
eukprot:4485882-Lingulodinium_polyedra.AAC.1